MNTLVKVLDWGEDGMATAAETAALRTSFRQEVAVWHKLDHPNVTKVNIVKKLANLHILLLYFVGINYYVAKMKNTACSAINFIFLL